MYLEPTKDKDHRKSKILVRCDNCGKEEIKQYRGCEVQLVKYGRHLCRACALLPENRGGNEPTITTNCSKCGRVFVIAQNSYNVNINHHNGTYICRSCAQLGRTCSEATKEKLRRAALGKTLSETTKQKLREVWKHKRLTLADRKRLSKISSLSRKFSGKKHTPETKAKMSAAKKGKRHTMQHRANISKGRKKMLADQGGLLPTTIEKLRARQLQRIYSGEQKSSFNAGYINTKWGQFYCRSSYERRFLKILERTVPSQISVISGESKRAEDIGVIIWYVNPLTGRKHRYLPDFIVGNVIIELKPRKLISHPINKAKIAAAKAWCIKNNYTFEVWTEDKLEEYQAKIRTT